MFCIWGNSRFGGGPIALDRGIVQSLFPFLPNISGARGSANLDDIIAVVQTRFREFRTATIHKVLKDFLRSLKGRSAAFLQLEPSVTSRMVNFLDLDIRSIYSRRDGISKARCYFAVLSRFAEKTGSRSLAKCMVRAFWAGSQEVITYERDDWLYIWLTALNCLRSVYSHREVDECIAYLCKRGNSIRNTYYNMGRYDPQIEQLLRKMDRMMDHMDRGRNYDRTIIYPRARTLPPPVRTAVPMLMPAPAWTSAYASPAIGPYDEYFREAEMEEMRERLEQVEFHQQVQGEQLGLLPPSPMASLALPWPSD